MAERTRPHFVGVHLSTAERQRLDIIVRRRRRATGQEYDRAKAIRDLIDKGHAEASKK